MQQFVFTGFTADDLLAGAHLDLHASFVMPGSATLEFTVADDDHFLSGDAHRNEHGDDQHGQTATITRDMAVNARDEAHAARILEIMAGVEGVEVLDHYDRTFRMHEGGKIEVLPLCSVGDRDDLSMAYTPGVARVCMAIHDNPTLAHEYTIKKNTVAIVSDARTQRSVTPKRSKSST